MEETLNLGEIRNRIDEIDNELIKLFEERMKTVTSVAEYKIRNNMNVLNTKREREIVNRICAKVDPELSVYSKILYNTLFDLSRSYQSKIIFKNGETAKKIEYALNSTNKQFPSSAVVACQGTEGANSQSACEKLFFNPSIKYYESFRDVFEAIKNGECTYGILPLENSVHGTVTKVVDLMGEYDFNIVKATKIQINHNLLVKNPKTPIENIREIYSHEQALGQCDKYLSTLKNVKLVKCENTAVASKLVSESPREDIAAISSAPCAELYGLKIINSHINNTENNYTRFICISGNNEIYPGADKMSFMVSISHQPGALYNLISKFAALGINMTKIESRPIPGKDFEFMFYFEMGVSAYSQDFISLVTDLENSFDSFKFLGCYLEN